jgi:hypothetical protein
MAVAIEVPDGQSDKPESVRNERRSAEGSAARAKKDPYRANAATDCRFVVRCSQIQNSVAIEIAEYDSSITRSDEEIVGRSK